MDCGKCGLCGVKNRVCNSPDGTGPAFCSTNLYKKELEKADAEYSDPENLKMALESARQEKSGYENINGDPRLRMAVKPRILETVEFCKRMGYKKIGLAFCMGLKNEASVVTGIFQQYGLEVVSVICKVGGVDKSRVGITDGEKLNLGGHESMCNPIAQAEILNSEKTEFNVLLGLCVGHDSLFLKYSEACCTVLAVKDRVLGHNPLAAVYTCDSYYKYIK